MSETPETPAGLTEHAFDLLDWIESGTVARRQVVIHNNPRVAEEFATIEARLAELGHTDDETGDGTVRDEPLGGSVEDAEIEQLLAAREDVEARWEAARSTWTVRAVSQEEVEASFDEVPPPKPPLRPKNFDAAPDKIRAAFVEASAKHQRANAKANEDRQIVLIATALVSIETARGTATSVSVDALRALRSKPHGKQWIDKLYAAVDAATSEDPEVPRPTSSGRSTSTQA